MVYNGTQNLEIINDNINKITIDVHNKVNNINILSKNLKHIIINNIGKDIKLGLSDNIEHMEISLQEKFNNVFNKNYMKNIRILKCIYRKNFQQFSKIKVIEGNNLLELNTLKIKKNIPTYLPSSLIKLTTEFICDKINLNNLPNTLKVISVQKMEYNKYNDIKTKLPHDLFYINVEINKFKIRTLPFINKLKFLDDFSNIVGDKFKKLSEDKIKNIINSINFDKKNNKNSYNFHLNDLCNISYSPNDYMKDKNDNSFYKKLEYKKYYYDKQQEYIKYIRSGFICRFINMTKHDMYISNVVKKNNENKNITKYENDIINKIKNAIKSDDNSNIIHTINNYEELIKIVLHKINEHM